MTINELVAWARENNVSLDAPIYCGDQDQPRLARPMTPGSLSVCSVGPIYGDWLRRRLRELYKTLGYKELVPTSGDYPEVLRDQAQEVLYFR